MTFLLFSGLAIDESNMNGEPEAAKKSPKKPILLSGTQVAEGNGEMLVTNVGMRSEWGITYSKLIVPQEDTPLQESLGDLAKKIGYIGFVVAVLVFLVLVARLIAKTGKFNNLLIELTYIAHDWEWNNLRQFLQFFTLSITIVVAAVPEGLPLAVTISLAYSMRAMLKDNNLVRHLQACETMGGATNICSDKTGTLTENRMTVTNGWFANKKFGDNLEESLLSTLNKTFIDMLCVSVSTNSAISTFIKFPKDSSHKMEFIGSKTECALLLLTHKLKYDYNDIRKQNKVLVSFPFSSEKKRSSCVVDVNGSNRLFVKGASEIILGLCDNYIDENMTTHDLSEEFKQSLNKTIESMASEGLRTLTIAYKDIKEVPEEGTNAPDDHLTLIGIVGIKDPLRPEVPDAIRQCKSAGITVRMVTGDNKLTATSIAKSCGILHDDSQVVLEGPEFRKMSDEELDRILPKLAVLARSSPSDKHRLVTRLKVLREVVAVTGDGTNDGPALKAADVGFGMGIAGTEIAKEAADIIIMDDNFASIVKAVMWGRCVRGNIQKFLTFQLTVNLVSLSIVFIAAVAGYGEPLKPIQFLWINLIQDTFAALALATEKPTPDLLDRLPAGRTERLITPTMWRNMVLGALYQLAILLMILFAGDKIWNLPPIENPEANHDPTVQYTILFNTFVIFQLFNEINCREPGNDWNAFRGIFSNWLFSAVVIGSMGLQIIFVQVGGESLGTSPLNVVQWFSCIGLAASILIVMAAVRTLVPPPQWHWLKYNVPIQVGGFKLAEGHQDDEDSKSESGEELKVKN